MRNSTKKGNPLLGEHSLTIHSVSRGFYTCVFTISEKLGILARVVHLDDDHKTPLANYRVAPEYDWCTCLGNFHHGHCKHLTAVKNLITKLEGK